MRGFAGLLLLVARRAMATPQALAIRFAGMLVAVILVAGVSLYSTAMGDAMLQARLGANTSNTELVISLTGQPLTGASYAALDHYIRNDESADLGLPLHNLHIHHNTSTVQVYRLGSRGMRLQQPVANLVLDYYEGLASHITMVTGTLKTPARLPDGDAPVLISEYTAQSLHLSVGDRVAFSGNNVAVSGPPLIITGIFVPTDSGSSFWDINAGNPTYRSLMAPSLETFQLFAAQGGVFSPQYFWLQETDATAIHLSTAPSILERIDRVRSKIADIAQGTSLLTSLDMSISGFLNDYNLLPDVLFILLTPIIGLILYAVAMTTGLVLDRQATEVVLMRSRGATRLQVFGLYVVEGLALGIVATLVGPWLGLPLARLIGRASGFLSFGGGLPFSLQLQSQTYLYAAITAALCLLAGLLPSMALARRSMLSFKAEQARASRRPFWQRFYLDLVALACALYGLVLLIQQGPVTSGAATAAVAQDPLIAAAPLLFGVAITLLFARVLPWLAALGLRALGVVSSASTYVALQTVARAPRQPMRLVQLCALTLTLGICAATVASVEGRNLTDQYMYSAGSTVRLQEIFDRQDAPARLKNEPDIMPLSTHLALPGVRAAMPGLRYESGANSINTTGDGTEVNVLGIDPATAQRVIWFRPDFAAQSLTSLLNSIAPEGPNALVSDSFLSATGLHQGDSFTVSLTNGAQVALRVAGAVHYFPTLDPKAFPFVVTNLAYLERASKSHGPNEVWLDTVPSQTSIDRLLAIAELWPRHIISYQGLPPTFTVQNNPLVAGIYGVVSIGFLIAVALALLGFVTYTYLALQQRLAEVAILRALGLSQSGVRTLLIFEQVFLLGAAILGGITAGLLTTQLFLPFLPIATNVLPPFLVVMPWSAVGQFVLAILVIFILVLSAAISLLLRMQIGQVLRLGEG